MLTYDPDDDYSECVCVLLPGGKATLVDSDFFERHLDENWLVLGTCVFFQRRHTVIANPTARVRNRRTRVRYTMEAISRLVARAPFNKQADHINRNRFDNRSRNLRIATGAQNAKNSAGKRGRTSRYKGVYRSNGKWISTVTFEGNRYFLGRFTDETAAALAYNAFVKAHCPEFGYLNPVSGATSADEPTVVKAPPTKRKSQLKKLTLTQKRVKRINAWIARSAIRHLAKLAEAAQHTRHTLQPPPE